MTIKTYGNQLMSRWQSALYAVLDQGEKPIDALGSEHPAMVASCIACEALEREMLGAAYEPQGEKVADPIETTDLMRECARLYVGLLGARMMGNQAKVIELENELRYSVCDPLWAKTLFEFRKGEDKKIPYRRYRSMDDFVVPLPEKEREKESLKIAFVSDWATGTAVARNVMRNIADQQPDVVIHLGDIYYSGTRKECEENFLNVVRTYLPASVPVYTLAGNHDLYAGGEGYYWLLDQVDQPASYFCLRNDDWQILAVGAPPETEDPADALTHVPTIDEQEVAWHKDKIQNSGGRKTVMLSHYQLFTASGNIGRTPDNRPLAINPVLHNAFKDELEKIDLWMWGHEHNFIVFNPYLGLERGRCIGSGALPVSLIWQPYSQLPNLALPDHITEPPRINLDAQLGHDGDHYHHGYGVLTLDGEEGEMVYYQVAGTEGDSEIIYQEKI